MEYQSFDTMEELVGYLQEQSRLAKERYEGIGSPEVPAGTKYYTQDRGFLIVGEVLDPLAIGFPDGRPEDEEEAREYDYEKWSYEDSRKRGYVFVRAYSEVVPYGEMGSTHVTNLNVIPEQVFQEVKQRIGGSK